MVYKASKKNTKYCIKSNVIKKHSNKCYTVSDFTKGVKRYEMIGRLCSGISENESKKAYIKSLICAMSAGFSKENVIDIRDRYISLCHVLDGSNEMKIINEMIDTCVEEDDIDSLIFGFDISFNFVSETSIPKIDINGK